MALPPLRDRRPRAGRATLGTQGTPVEVLGKLIAQRQLPQLWQARSRLVELFDAERDREG